MPELPDVEGFRRELADQLPGRRVRAVDVYDAGVLRNLSGGRLTRALTGRRFGVPKRHGKWLILPTDEPVLLIHSGMTGRPYHARSDDAQDGEDRLRIRLDRGELRYADRRKLRGIWLAEDDSKVQEIIGPQGTDALTIDLDGFTEALRGRRGKLKPTLQDQSVLAGLGNLLADEICWRAKVNPARKITDLDTDDRHRLHGTMRRTLHTAVRHGCVPGLRGWLTRVRDDENGHCPRCHTSLEHGRLAGRATVWCPRCQPR